jgi:hypothetical protein
MLTARIRCRGNQRRETDGLDPAGAGGLHRENTYVVHVRRSPRAGIPIWAARRVWVWVWVCVGGRRCVHRCIAILIEYIAHIRRIAIYI